jgi:hypothetical protein
LCCDDENNCTIDDCHPYAGSPRPGATGYCTHTRIDCRETLPLTPCLDETPAGSWVCKRPLHPDCARVEFDTCDPERPADLVCGAVTLINFGGSCSDPSFCLGGGSHVCVNGRCLCR